MTETLNVLSGIFAGTSIALVIWTLYSLGRGRS